MQRPAWAEINLSALAFNMREIRRITSPQAKIMAVVKANAYGHGIMGIAETVLQHGADTLGVATLGEAIKLRERGFLVPILIFGYTPFEFVREIVFHDLIQTVYTYKAAEVLSQEGERQKKKVKIHLKIDTGMSRLGFMPDESSIKDIERIARLPYLEMEGVFTHFAVADIADKSYTLYQIETFTDFLGKLKKIGIDFPIRHAANSAAIMEFPEAHFDMVRPGILMYGYYPSGEVDKSKLELIPVMTVKAKAAFLKTIAKGQTVSYGRRFSAPETTKILTLPIGYADGFSRLLSGKMEVLVRGQRRPSVGTVCMDQFMVDVTGIDDIHIGDEVVVFGRQNGQFISVDELAEKMGTINYEILCGISERIPRVYIK